MSFGHAGIEPVFIKVPDCPHLHTVGAGSPYSLVHAPFWGRSLARQMWQMGTTSLKGQRLRLFTPTPGADGSKGLFG
ncbi:hypothetical protein M5X66_18470 (plasmid) [Providencia sp. PROV188]|uniref:hypothetical protein n=1 Tax=Providencia sp. PROV188 TaxID=2939731 RepID=UPI0020512EFF|nr:hypothetical protein [Providencia sp.]WBM62626.1 hypothetical protein M5X66_18470 [Providencia sp. PROV188]